MALTSIVFVCVIVIVFIGRILVVAAVTADQLAPTGRAFGNVAPEVVVATRLHTAVAARDRPPRPGAVLQLLSVTGQGDGDASAVQCLDRARPRFQHFLLTP